MELEAAAPDLAAGPGQMADTHASNWPELAHRLADLERQGYAFMAQNAESAAEEVRMAGEEKELGLLVEATRVARLDAPLNERLNDMQTLQTRLDEVAQRQGRLVARVSWHRRKQERLCETITALFEELSAVTAEMAHFCETNPVACGRTI